MVFLAEGGIGALGFNVPSLLARLINFTILFLVLGWAFKRFLFPLLDERRHRIQEGLDASEEAKRRLSETEKEVAGELDKARQAGQTLIRQAQPMSPPPPRGGPPPVCPRGGGFALGARPQRDTAGAGRRHRGPPARVRRPYDYRRRARDQAQPGPQSALGADRGGAGGGARRGRGGRPDVIRGRRA